MEIRTDDYNLSIVSSVRDTYLVEIQNNKTMLSSATYVEPEKLVDILMPLVDRSFIDKETERLIR